MKILICLILLALIYFIYKKYFAGDKSSNGQDAAIGSEDSTVNLGNKSTTDTNTTDAASDSSANTTSGNADDSNLGAGTAAAAVAATAAVAASAASAASAAGTVTSSANSADSGASASPSENPAQGSASNASAAASGNVDKKTGGHALPVEHLVGIDRRIGKALRALGITDTNALANAGTEQLQAVGLDIAATKTLQAQAALSALQGVTPHEASLLAGCGIDSIATLAKQDPAALVCELAQINRHTGVLKSVPGVQQLQRLINSANVAA